MTKESSTKYEAFSNEPTIGNGASGVGKDFTIEEAIEHIGFGWIQIKILLMAGLVWISDGMEILVLSILGPALMCEWGISKTEEAFLTTAVFIGIIIGCWVFGWLADRHGRRKMMWMSAMWMFYFGILSSTAPNLLWLYVIRALVGIGIGGGLQVMTYYSEFLPINHRGQYLMLIEIFFSFGAVLEAFLAFLLMKSGWRIWLFASALPTLLFIVCCKFLPTSPWYDISCGNADGARTTLEKLAKANGKVLPPGDLIATRVKKRGRFADLIEPEYKLTSGLLAVIWFCSQFIYIGLVLFTTNFIAIGNTCPRGGNMNQNITNSADANCLLECKRLTDSDYLQLVWTSAAEIPGLLLTVYSIISIGRRNTLITEYAILAVSCACLMICMGKIPMLCVLFLCRALATSGVQTLYVYTPEVYPTHVRALSLGLASAIGRLGATVTPYIAEVLLRSSQYAGITVYSMVSVLAAITAFFLPIETKGRHLT